MLSGRFVFLALFCLLVAGCGGGADGRLQISGKVTFEGDPVDDGKIVFMPSLDGLPMATTAIVNGEYEIPASHGPRAGEYLVKIEAYKMVKDPSIPPHPYLDDPNQGMVPKQYLPKKFNQASTLKAAIDPSKSNYDFDL